MQLSYADLDTDIQSLESLLAYLLDVYYDKNSREQADFLDSAGQRISLPLIFRNQGIITTNGVICDEFFLRIPYINATNAGASVPANDYRWRYASHVEQLLFELPTPAPFPSGWKTANLIHTP